jgi:hypothetical protein
MPWKIRNNCPLQSMYTFSSYSLLCMYLLVPSVARAGTGTDCKPCNDCRNYPNHEAGPSITDIGHRLGLESSPSRCPMSKKLEDYPDDQLLMVKSNSFSATHPDLGELKNKLVEAGMTFKVASTDVAWWHRIGESGKPTRS